MRALNYQKLLAYHELGISAEVAYLLGAKPSLDALPASIRNSDCSGWFRYLLYHASLHALTLPEGSVEQHEWCIDQSLQQVNYLSVGEISSRLLACFIDPATSPGGIGHVFLSHGGQTLECYGGHGVGRRAWNAPIEGGRTNLAYACRACFVLPIA